MVLPLYLALTGAEISKLQTLSFPCAYMACHFSPYSQGLAGVPESLPPESILILDDQMECSGHDPQLVARQLQNAAAKLDCSHILLDFQRPSNPESQEMVRIITHALPCPVAVTQGFADGLTSPVFLSPAPLHVPLTEYISPWKDREIWLEAALGQEDIIVTKEGTNFIPRFLGDGYTDGLYCNELCCRYRTKIDGSHITFTLFDTAETLEKKLELAQSLGVTRAVGLWQELDTIIRKSDTR